MTLSSPARDGMPVCANADAHTWLPLQFVMDATYGIPDRERARVYLVCTRCWRHTSVGSTFMGYYYEKPPPLVDVLQRDVKFPLPLDVQELHDAAQDLLETDAEDERKMLWYRLANAVVAVRNGRRVGAVPRCTVRFVAKPEWQKDDCIRCGGEATMAAEIGSASVRCCDKSECMAAATNLALVAHRDAQ